MTQVLIVLGMHRSGTSAIAGILTKLGGAAPKTLYPGDIGNERGYFESVPMMAFHDELLASAGSHWCDWRAFNTAWYSSPLCETYKDRAKTLFEDEFGDAAFAIFKDPRICRFLPFWLDVFAAMNITSHVVIPVRSPLEVANSLNKRNNLPLHEGMLLWLRHVLDAEAASRALPRSIVMWREFVSDHRGATDKISRDIGLSWPRPSDEGARDIEGFLSADLVHNTVSDAELAACPDVHQWTADSYEALAELVRDPQSLKPMKRLDQVRERFDQSATLFGGLLADADTRTEDLMGRIGSMQAERDSWRDRYAAVDADRSAERSAAERRLEAAMNKNAELAAKLRAAAIAGESLRKDKQALDALLERTRLEASQQAAEFRAQAKEEARRHDEALNGLHEKLTDAEAAVAHLEFQSAKRTLPSVLAPRALRKWKLVRELVRSGLFDSAWYLAQYEEVRRCGLAPAQHYLERGFRNGYLPNPFFDTRWYLQRNEDVRRSGVNPLIHYAIHGWREGRDPGPGFQTRWYLEANPDVKASGTNPLAHYLRYGRAEGRLPVAEGFLNEGYCRGDR
jgi:hypothetical protein